MTTFEAGARLPAMPEPRTARATINPDLLVWARTTAGLSLEAAAKKIGVKPSRLMEWEHGLQRPTVPQLRKAANVYKRPLAVFFRARPPATIQPLHDFRRFPDQQPPGLSSDLLLEMRRARRRRAVALELLGDLDRPVTTLAVRASMDDDPEEVGARGRDWLGVTLQQQARWQGTYEALNNWVVAFEAQGFLVFQTSYVALDEMRGFSLGDRRAPVIVLNAKDHPRGRVFTLMHEFAHVMLDTGGVCDPQRVGRQAHDPDERVEVFCNHVAGALLVPSAALLADARVAGLRGREWPEATILTLADAFAVSREVILRRLLILGRTTEDFYETKRREYLAQYAQLAQARRQEGYAPIFRLALRDNGRRYTGLVLDAYERDRITPADVSDYLGVRLKHLDEIAGALDRATRRA
jgi:Zn-dependent peptidase ImmA (M78 family)/transcriptional regulator with XRE-family HTH domain